MCLKLICRLSLYGHKVTQELHFNSNLRVHTMEPLMLEPMLWDSFSTSDNKPLLERVQHKHKIPCLSSLVKL